MPVPQIPAGAAGMSHTAGPILLRDYQKACLEAILIRYKAGIRRQLVCLPTGTGKTIIFSQFPAFFGMKKRMLVLAHREELLHHAREKVLHANPALRVDIEQAFRQAGGSSDVVVASVQTLGRKHSSRLSRLNPDEFYLVVVDEAHHAAAPSYRRILEHFGIFDRNTAKLLVGFTATPKRGDSIGLDSVFEEIPFSRSLAEMVQSGHLAPLAAFRVETAVDLSGVRTQHGDFMASQLSRAVNVRERNDLVVRLYKEHLKGRRTLCFCVDVNHTEALAQEFNRNGIPAAAVTGQTPTEQRAAALADFKSGVREVLTNCMVLTEGYDESSVSGILLARPTKSALLYTQMIGRGTRLHPGKENVVIIDVVDVTKQHKLVNLATLFGLPPRFNLAGRTATEAVQAIRWIEENRPWVRTDNAFSFDELRYHCRRIDLLSLQTPLDIEKISNFVWMHMGSDRFRLALAEGEHLAVYLNILGKWEVTRHQKDKDIPVAVTQDRKSAVLAADRYVSQYCTNSIPLVSRHFAWRNQPATKKQKELLLSKGLKIPAGLTKGQASHVINMLLAGAPRMITGNADETDRI